MLDTFGKDKKMETGTGPYNQDSTGKNESITATPSKPEQYNLALAGPGYVVGYEDILSMRNCSTTMKCKSDQGKVLTLKDSELRKIFKKDQ